MDSATTKTWVSVLEFHKYPIPGRSYNYFMFMEVYFHFRLVVSVGQYQVDEHLFIEIEDPNNCGLGTGILWISRLVHSCVYNPYSSYVFPASQTIYGGQEHNGLSLHTPLNRETPKIYE